MKTKEQVVRHLKEAGYNQDELGKIMGFLIGKELKDADEILQVKKGDKTFKNFMSWFNGEDKDNEDKIKEMRDGLSKLISYQIESIVKGAEAYGRMALDDDSFTIIPDVFKREMFESIGEGFVDAFDEKYLDKKNKNEDEVMDFIRSLIEE